MTISLRTPRVLLREWRDADREPFAAISADPEVMAMLPPLPTRAASDAWIAKTRAHWADHGFGIWALEIPGEAELIGGVGFHEVPFPASFAPVAIAWRLGRRYWGLGYAFEAARAAIDDAFGRLGFDEIVAYTTIVNRRSLALMERLSMRRDPRDDFDHPNLSAGHPLRRHGSIASGERDEPQSRTPPPSRSQADALVAPRRSLAVSGCSSEHPQKSVKPALARAQVQSYSCFETVENGLTK